MPKAEIRRVLLPEGFSSACQRLAPAVGPILCFGIIVLTIQFQERAPPHEQAAFIKLKQDVYNRFVQLRGLLSLTWNTYTSKRHRKVRGFFGKLQKHITELCIFANNSHHCFAKTSFTFMKKAVFSSKAIYFANYFLK